MRVYKHIKPLKFVKYNSSVYIMTFFISSTVYIRSLTQIKLMFLYKDNKLFADSLLPQPVFEHHYMLLSPAIY
jgi:hypothetical protein